MVEYVNMIMRNEVESGVKIVICSSWTDKLKGAAKVASFFMWKN